MPALRLARTGLGLNRSRLDLIEKLLACVPGHELRVDTNNELIVHVSNARLAEMTNRDCDKTITRLISEIEQRGLLTRKSSPNGKRYCRRASDGTSTAYGLDLSALLHQMPRIEALAEQTRAQADACRTEKEACSLLILQLMDINVTRADAEQTAILNEARRLLRRKPVLTDLRLLRRRLAMLIDPDPTRVPVTTEEMGTNAPQNTCHKEPEPIPYEKKSSSNRIEPDQQADHPPRIRLSCALVERSLPRVAGLGRQLNGSLRELIATIVQYLGISPRLWQRTLEAIEFDEAALLAMYLYEKQRSIQNPGGYLQRVIQNEPPGALPGSRVVQRLATHG